MVWGLAVRAAPLNAVMFARGEGSGSWPSAVGTGLSRAHSSSRLGRLLQEAPDDLRKEAYDLPPKKAGEAKLSPFLRKLWLVRVTGWQSTCWPMFLMWVFTSFLGRLSAEKLGRWILFQHCHGEKPCKMAIPKNICL